ncbi:MAG TPA: WbqC family protein [Pyrinomonadaceae bacterium]
MARTLVVSQPMFLPWVGLFEQIRLADVFIHYDDVQLPQGRSFMSRVQLKSANGVSWLTVPIDHGKSGKLLNEVVLLEPEGWREKHLRTIRHAYARRPYFNLMFELIEKIYSQPTAHLAEFNITAIEQIAQWLALSPRFIRSSAMGVKGASTERLVALCEAVDCDVYVTGHGALRYLNHQQFEDKGVSVCYMDYKKVPYEQGHGEFTPYISILDAIANCGERARDLLCSAPVYWRDFTVS